MEYLYTGDEYKNLIGKTFKFRLMDGDMHIPNFDNQIGLTKIAHKYLPGNEMNGDTSSFNFEKSIKNLVNIGDKINMIVGYNKPKAEMKYDGKRQLLAF